MREENARLREQLAAAQATSEAFVALWRRAQQEETAEREAAQAAAHQTANTIVSELEEKLRAQDGRLVWTEGQAEDAVGIIEKHLQELSLPPGTEEQRA